MRKEDVNIHDGDKWVGEELICGNCGTRRAFYFDETFGYRMVDCACAKARREAEERRCEEEARAIEAYRNRLICFSEMRTYRKFTFDTIDKPEKNIEDSCLAFCDNFAVNLRRNSGMLFWGSSGYGKTTIAACVANKVISAGYTAKIKSVPNIIYDLQSSYDKNHILRELNSYDLLILDDFGSQHENEYSDEMIFALFEARKSSGKPVIITTNLLLSDIKDPSTQRKRRIYERILEMCPYPVEFKEMNRRRVEVIEKYRITQKEFNEYLGLDQ